MSQLNKAFAQTLLAAAGIVFTAVGLLLLAPLADGQGITTGTISGTVVDPSGAVVRGARVTATSSSQGTTRQTTSNGAGFFSFFDEPAGAYILSISAPGFSTAAVSAVQVNAGATTDVNAVKLGLGNATTQVEVNDLTAGLLQTRDSQVTTTFSAQTIETIPLDNGFDTAAELIPGVVSTHGDSFSNQNGDNYSGHGQSGRYNNSEIDGQSNNDNSVGGPQFFFQNQDAIEEIEVLSNDFGSQYGRDAGAIINYITKSGTNAFHGTGFEMYQGQFLSSLTNAEKSPVFGYCSPGQSPSTGCSPVILPRFTENRYGGTLGGPIWKDKVFFFGSTFWDHIREGATPVSSLPYLTPDATGLQELGSAFPGNAAVAAITGFGPYSISAGSPVPAPVPASLCPGAETAEGYCDEAITGPGGAAQTVEMAGVSRSLAPDYSDQEEMGRVDFQPTRNDRLFLRYLYQNQIATSLSPGEAGAIANGDFYNYTDLADSAGADWTHTFSASWINQLRYSFQETKLYFAAGAYPDCTASNLGACPAQLDFQGTNDDLGFGVNANFPQGRTVKTTQVQNNAIWTHGNHTLLFGGEYDNQNSPNFGLAYFNGDLNYQTLSDFLQLGSSGDAYAQLAQGSPVIPFTENDAAGYVQDNWRVTPNFTAHIGLRWEFFGQAVNELHDETVARESNPSTAIWDTSLPLSARTFPSANQFYDGYEPRIGFAWNPGFDKQLVVKAGYAIDENPAFYNMFTNAASDAPVVTSGEVSCVPGESCLPASGSLTGNAVRALNLPFLPSGGDPRQLLEAPFPANFRPPYVQTYTLALDHQIRNGMVGEVRYTGSKTTHDFQSLDANPYLANVAAAFPNQISPSALCQDPSANGFGRLDCNYSNESEFTNGGWANYNGLELNLTARDYHGLTMTAAYTWSKDLNNATDGLRSTGGAGSSIAYAQNPLDPSAGERGLSGNDFPNVVGMSFSYQVPKLTSEGNLLSRLTNGFVLAGVYRFNSGQVYTPFQGIILDSNTGDTSFCDGGFNAQTVGADTCRLAVSNSKAPVSTVAYLNPYTGPLDAEGNPTLGTPRWVAYRSDGFDQSGNYNPGTPIDPGSAHWIINNQAYALSVGNPYPGAGRSLLRGQTYSDLDGTLIKNTTITERVRLQLSVSAYNALNQMYLGTGYAFVGSSSFTETQFNASGQVPSGTGDVSGNRFFVLGTKLIF